MKALAVAGLVVLGLGALGWAGLNCCDPGSIQAGQSITASTEPESGEVVVEVPVKGMTCAGCTAAIRMAVKRLDGVSDVRADHEKGLVTVTYIEGKVTIDRIVEAINRTGYKASAPQKRAKR